MKKASGGDVIPSELSKILKDDAVKVLHLICEQIWKTRQRVTRLQKVSFQSNPKDRQCRRMSKLPQSCTHFTCQQGYAQNPSSKASTIHEPRTSRCASWIQKEQRNQITNQLDHRKGKGIYFFKKRKEIYFCLTTLKSLTMWITTHGKILKGMGITDHPTCLLRTLYEGQEATVRMRHGKMD